MSADEAMNTSIEKVRALQSRLSCAAKQSLDRRFGALYDKLYQADVLMEAWRRVRGNHGSAGVDQESIEYIEEEIGVWNFLEALGEELRTQRYRPQPVRRCWIDKPGKPGEKRPLGIPTVRDRVCQCAAVLVLEPIFETNFLPCSHGFRPEHSPHTAIDAVRRAITFEGLNTVVEVDIVGYYNNIKHDILLKLLERRISDKRMLKLIKSWLKAGVMEDGRVSAGEDIGVPQGGSISPLLSNVYLHSFDKMFAQSGIRGILVRYADDFVVLVKDGGARVKELIGGMLRRLGLEMHSEKSTVTKAHRGFDFLGTHFRVTPVRKRASRLKTSCKMWPSEKSVRKIKARVKQVIGRRYSLSLKELVAELNPVVSGWVNFHRSHGGFATEKTMCATLNWFLHERIRIFLKRKHSDPGRGARRVAGNLLDELGLARFQWSR